jgi:PAS domain S-box-containing protein
MNWIIAGTLIAIFLIGSSIGWNLVLRAAVRRQTAELRQTEERLDAQFQNIPVPTFCWRRSGDDFVSVDQNIAASKLYSGTTYSADNLSANVTLSRWPEGLSLLHQCYREKRTLYHIGKRPIMMPDQERWKSTTFVYLPPDIVMVHSEDINDEKEAEFSLRESEERYRTLIDLSVDGICVRDETDYLFANDAAAVLLGYENGKDLIGENWMNFILPEDAGGAVDRYRALLLAEEPQTPMDRVMVRRDGARIETELWSEKITWKGQPALLGMIRDISRRKQAERELISAKEKAEHANDSKTRFLAAASHDLRQPVQAISFLNYILRDKIADETILALLDQLETNTGVIEKLLEDLLDISRLDAGVVEADIQDIALEEVLENVRNSFAASASEAGVELRIVPNSAIVRSDQALLGRILQNLVGNAIKFTDEGKVLVGCRHLGNTIRIDVCDTGKGIATADFKNIFEEFYQIDNPARDRRRGIGLGLSIVRRLARVLGHPLDIASVPNRGARFSVSLPLMKASGDLQEIVK